MREVTTDSDPSQTAALKAAWLLGSLAGINDGTENQSLSEIRVENRFEALSADEAALEEVEPPPDPVPAPSERASACGTECACDHGCAGGFVNPVGCRSAPRSAPAGRSGS